VIQNRELVHALSEFVDAVLSQSVLYES